MCEVGEVAPRSVETHTGQVCVHVMRRSVRSCRFVSACIDAFIRRYANGEARKRPVQVLHTIPVAGSTSRDNVSTAMT